MLRTIKFMFLGIAFILLGVWGAVFSLFADMYVFPIIAIICPILGVGFCIGGFFVAESDKERAEETEEDK